MPEINPESISWDDRNLMHATRHGVSVSEIEQALANRPVYRQNKKGRQADYLAYGRTDEGVELSSRSPGAPRRERYGRSPRGESDHERIRA